MARKPAAAPQAAQVELNHEALATAGRALTVLSEEVLAIQKAFSLPSMDPNALREQLRVWVDHTARSMFMIGAHLVALRAVTPHGEWLENLGSLGVAPRAAQKFMQAAMKCVGTDGPRERMLQLERSKVLELVTLDDADLDELERTGGIKQLQLELDDIDRMSVTQLRDALREREQGLAAKDKVIAAKDKKLNALDEQLHRPFKADAESEARNAEEKALLDGMRDRIVEVEGAFTQMQVMAERMNSMPLSAAVTQALANNLTYLAQRVADVLTAAGTDVDFAEMVTPTWIKAAKAKKKA
jgi:hypothetical protein